MWGVDRNGWLSLFPMAAEEPTAVADQAAVPPTDARHVALGLTTEQVAERVARGATNDVPDRASRSVGEIVRANVFTRINAILGVLLAIVLATGSIIDGMFGLLIILNSAIGIVQEIRAKWTLDRLAIVSQAKPLVRRDGVVAELPPHDVVLDDIIELGPGDQAVVDGVVVETEGLELDESLLTGEADPVHKELGARVLSGSFVAAGSGSYRATKVGRDAYAARLAEEASKFTLVHSELRAGIDKILKFITYLMIPAGLLIIYNQLFSSGQPLGPALSGMVAALVPMVPEGLVLMTSIAFAVGVIRLGHRQCLVQELPAIEGLARVDVVCADKTGTLTENGMRLADLVCVDGSDEAAVRAALAAMAADDPRPNASVLAVREALPDDPGWGGGHRRRPVLVREEVERPVLRHSRQLGARRPPTCFSIRPRRRPGAPRNWAHRDCECCCWADATGQSTTRRPPAPSPRRPSSCSNSGCGPTPSPPSSTSRASTSTSRSSPATTPSRSALSRRRSACRTPSIPSMPAPCRRTATGSPTPSTRPPRSVACDRTRSARWSVRCNRAGTPSP